MPTNVLNQIVVTNSSGTTITYKIGDLIEGYYDSTSGKFYVDSSHTTEIEGAPGFIYVDLAGNSTYIYKAASSSFVNVAGAGADNIKFGYLNETDGKFYEDDQYTVEIAGDPNKIFIDLAADMIYRYDSTDIEFVPIGGGGGSSYEAGFNIKIENNVISTKTFVGTYDEWNNLTSAQKAKFDTVNITDDGTTPIATPGHEVLDSTDTPLPQRTNIQFEGAEATDDSTNDITKVTITPYTAGDGIEIDDHEVSVTEDRPATFVGTTQEWDALTAAEKAQYKIVNLTNDIAGGEMVVVDTIEDGNINPISSQGVFNELGGYIDITGIPANALIDDLITSVTSKGMRPYSASILSFGSGAIGPSVAPVISTLTGGSGLRYFCVGLNITSTISVYTFASDAVIRIYFRK